MFTSHLKTLVTEPTYPGWVDTALASLGISAAVVSASFAGYMALVGPGSTSGPSGDQAIPASVTRETHAPLMAREVLPSRAAMPNGIDFTPTGTVPGDEPGAERDPLLPDPETVHDDLQDFAVRDVFDGTALVETRDTIQLVKPGTILKGAGEVLSIERKGSTWVVKTAGGIIGQRR